jgi:hypothetical protein
VLIAKTLSLLILLLAPAQQPGERDLDRLFARIDEVRSRLELTPQQVEQVRPILRDEFLKLRDIQDKYDGEDQNARTRLRMARELKDIQGDADDRLKKILTKKQMTELKKIREEIRDQLRESRGRRGR